MKGNITLPIAPFRRIVEEEMAPLLRAEIDNPVQTISFRARMNERMVFKILDPRSQSLEFDVADRLVTNLVGPMRWHTDEELSALYQSADLKRLDWVAPTSDVVLAEIQEQARAALREHKSAKKAAGAIGVTTRALTKALGAPSVNAAKRMMARPPYRRFRKPICPQGHDKREVGVTPSYGCLECHRQNVRDHRKRVAA